MGGIQYSSEVGRTLYGRTWHFAMGLDNHLETMLLSYPYKFTGDYLYFSNNLRDIKDHT